MKSKIALVAAVLVLATVTGMAQDAAAKRADIVRLLELTGASKNAGQAVDLMLPQLEASHAAGAG